MLWRGNCKYSKDLSFFLFFWEIGPAPSVKILFDQKIHENNLRREVSQVGFTKISN